MEIFKYTKLASESGKESVIGLVIFAAIAMFVMYKLSTRPEGLFSKSNVLILGGLTLFAVIAAKSVISRLQSSGEWEIIVDDKMLHWRGPEGIDHSFIVNFDQIQMVRVTLSDDMNSASYDLLMENGEQKKLSEETGMDFDEFLKALSDRGVKIETVEDRSYH